MSLLHDVCAGFRCPNCKSRQEYWHVRRLLWINRIWPLFIKSYGRDIAYYEAPYFDKVQCFSCKMDLHFRQPTTLKLEVACWGTAIAVFVAFMYWVLSTQGLTDKGPPLTPLTVEQELERIGQMQRGNNQGDGRLALVIFAALAAAPISYMIGRFVSYRFIKLRPYTSDTPLQPQIFEN